MDKQPHEQIIPEDPSAAAADDAGKLAVSTEVNNLSRDVQPHSEAPRVDEEATVRKPKRSRSLTSIVGDLLLTSRATGQPFKLPDGLTYKEQIDYNHEKNLMLQAWSDYEQLMKARKSLGLD